MTNLPVFDDIAAIVVGDVMLDVFHYGNVSRLSPEFPVPVMEKRGQEFCLGGAANVATNMKSLNAQVFLCSVIGNDEAANKVHYMLKDKNINCTGLISSKHRKTTIKNRIIGNGKQLLRIDEEDKFDLLADEEKQLTDYIGNLLTQQKVNVIVLQDYNKGVLSAQVIDKIIKLSKTYNIPICVDPKKSNFDRYNDVLLFKPNLKEFSEFCLSDFEDSEALKPAMKTFMTEHNINNLMITMADKGLMVMQSDENICIIPAINCNVVDVSGAGDTVIAVASLCLAAGLPVNKMANISNLAGGLVCEKPGIAYLSRQELSEKMKKFLQ
ncbi:MAG: bifunctional ADP-heptose synthase [Bacteroidales bacterium]|jgi:D-glycero-beta-D-manno-heptose-7-phosphate kinase|nr:bifunctional ADP-heptose synthase [Bacteroidales bacterium]MDD2204819.1 bifunctional ADP-heptose synthase [Bacteroidales bacterium]MDD3152622.1 bifunctional ADP-heptose synthase [Bacteroidales bacterium]MDD3914355.1 bifunctional ADP-heptose synthase [Bacteroidales bacterium]MDD4634096.1 bifunctional ADP-heptose synthase [Bacteroidales bacterium]